MALFCASAHPIKKSFAIVIANRNLWCCRTSYQNKVLLQCEKLKVESEIMVLVKTSSHKIFPI